MPVSDQTYVILPASDGDTGGNAAGALGNDPTLQNDHCGMWPGKTSGYRALFTRFELDVPKGVTITKARFTMLSQRDSVGGMSFRMGLLEKDGLWDVDGWTTANYPSTLPFPTTSLNNNIIPGILFQDLFLDGNVTFTTEFSANAAVTIGEGYPFLTFDTLTPVAQLQQWIDSVKYTPDGSDNGATAIVIDMMNPVFFENRFWIYMDDDPVFNGMTLDIGWLIPSVGRVEALSQLNEAVQAMADFPPAVSADTALHEAAAAESRIDPAVAGQSAVGPAVSGVMVLRRKVDALPEAA